MAICVLAVSRSLDRCGDSGRSGGRVGGVAANTTSKRRTSEVTSWHGNEVMFHVLVLEPAVAAWMLPARAQASPVACLKPLSAAKRDMTTLPGSTHATLKMILSSRALQSRGRPVRSASREWSTKSEISSPAASWCARKAVAGNCRCKHRVRSRHQGSNISPKRDFSGQFLVGMLGVPGKAAAQVVL
jgi:hypothetical protein